MLTYSNSRAYYNETVKASLCGYMGHIKPSQEYNVGKSRHYAFLFNTYVMLQIFNEINARKLLADEINPFSQFFANKFFLVILLISVVVQVGLVEIYAVAAILKLNPLNYVEIFASVGIGMSCIIWGKTSFITFYRFPIEDLSIELVRYDHYQ